MMTVMSIPPGGVGRRSVLRGRSGRQPVTGGEPSAMDVSGASGTDLVPAVGRADDPLAGLHREHYAALVRLASLVLGDVGLAEQVVQDAFVKLHLRWRGLRQLDRAPAYLRSAVLNAARRTVPPSSATPERAALERAEHERVVVALRQLPERQREALALRYYLDLPEAEIAAAMGVSAGSVKTHLHRALATLARSLREDV